MKLSTIQVAVSVSDVKYSTRNEEEYYEIELIDNGTGQLRKTYASPSNKNFYRWKQLMEYMKQNPDIAVCINGNFRTVNKRPEIISADCAFNHLEDFDLIDFLEMVQSVAPTN